MISRRRLLAASAAGVLAPTVITSSYGQGTWPTKPVRIIIPFPPGGGADIISRTIAAKLSEYWGQQVIVESRAGAGGNISTDAAVRSPADGYSIYMPSEFLAINPFLYSGLTFDAKTDLVPVTLVVQYPCVMVGPGNSSYKDLKEFIEAAKKDPGKLTFASPGTGTGPHLAGELFMRRAGIQITHVPYRGAGPAIPDTIAGRVDSFFNNIAPVMNMIKQGQMRCFAVTSVGKAPGGEELPTMAEQGLEGFDVAGWYGFYYQAGVPQEILKKVADDTARALAEPDVKKRFGELGLFIRGTGPAAMAAHFESEQKLWAPVIKDANIKLSN